MKCESCGRTVHLLFYVKTPASTVTGRLSDLRLVCWSCLSDGERLERLKLWADVLKQLKQLSLDEFTST